MSASQIIAFGAASVSGGTTRYTPAASAISFQTASNEEFVEVPIRDAGTFSHAYVRVTANSLSGSSTVTLRKSRVDTALVATVGAGQTGVFEDTSNSVSFANTDEADWEVTAGAGTTITIAVIGAKFTPDSGSNTLSYLFLGSGGTNITVASVNRYMPLAGPTTLEADEADVKSRIGFAISSRNLTVQINTNARTTDTTFRTRKNGANGGQSVTVGSGQTGVFEDSSGSDDLAASDDLNFSVTTGTGTETMNYRRISVSMVSTAGRALFACANTTGQTFNADGTDGFLALSGILTSVTTSEINAVIEPSFAFSLKGLTVLVPANTSSVSTVVRARKDGTNGTVSVSISASQTGTFTDLSNSDSVVAGDEINIMVDVGTGTGAIEIRNITVMAEVTQSPAHDPAQDGLLIIRGTGA